MSYENLLFEVKEKVGWLTINRPAKLNALNRQTLKEISDALEAVKRDENIRVLAITGAGEKAFIAGADIEDLAALSPSEAYLYTRWGQEIVSSIENLGKPVIAAVNGYALGGGCELALACHIRVASKTARFGQPEINLGILPGWGGTQRLSRLVGKNIALEYLLTGMMIDAEEAYRIGLVNKVVEPSDLQNAVQTLANLIASKAPVSVRCILDSVNYGLNAPFHEALALEASLFTVTRSTEDSQEGLTAFLQKRPPAWKGR